MGNRDACPRPTTVCPPRGLARCCSDCAGWSQRQTGSPELEAQLAKLEVYKAAHGDCSVPYGWAEDKQLGSWVSKQRTLKHKLDRGEPSQGMTAERVAKLEALGFA